MSDDPFTPAELEAAHDEIVDALDLDVTSPDGGDDAWRAAKAVLSAVAPLIAARVRAEVAEEIARAMEPLVDLSEEANDPAVLRERRICAAIARGHRTTPEPGDD